MLLVIFILLFFIILLLSIQIKLIICVKNEKMTMYLKLYILKVILIGKFNLNKSNEKINEKLKLKMKNTDKKELVKRGYRLLKKVKFNLEQFKLKIDISTADSVLTSYMVAVVSSFIGILLKITNMQINYKDFRYIVKPIYLNEKILNIRFACIISTNLVHIITIICKSLIEWRREDNGRKSSNRKAYGNSNG